MMSEQLKYCTEDKCYCPDELICEHGTCYMKRCVDCEVDQ